MEPIKRKVSVGMNTFTCPICAEANSVLRRKEFNGVLYVPVTMEQLAQLRVSDGYSTRKVKCHERGHAIEVQIHAQTVRV